MAAYRVLHFSDTHLSPRTQRFRVNNESMLEVLKTADHDAIIHTGDITLDGIRFTQDYEFSRDLFRSANQSIRFLPGNHDVGDNPRLGRPAAENGSAISPERQQRYIDYFGDDRWMVDLGDDWRLIGINSMLIGSGLKREEDQNVWIRQVLATLGDRHLALFSHQPFYIDVPDPLSLTYWTVDPVGREPLRNLMTLPNLRMIASGHLHQQRTHNHDGKKLEWCPSVAFTTTGKLVPEMGGARRIGYLEYMLHADGRIESRPIFPAEWENTYLDDVMEEVYPLLVSA